MQVSYEDYRIIQELYFEVVSKQQKMRAIAGGGRYDKLVGTYSKTDLPMCGFGFGDCVIMDLLAEKKLLPDLSPKVDYLIAVLDDELFVEGNRIANKLRQKYSVEILLKRKNLIQTFVYADKKGAEQLILVGKSEWLDQKIVVKDLRSKDKSSGQTMSLMDLYESIGVII